MEGLEIMGKKARLAARLLAGAPNAAKNAALLSLADLLDREQEAVLKANEQDVAAARAAGLTDALIDRLSITPSRLQGMATDLRRITELPDPVGEIFDQSTLPNGLRVHKQRVPIGVLGVIYESRPNVTIDVAGLAVKTGNVAILRGGSETLRSNQALTGLVHLALTTSGLPAAAIQFIGDADRARVLELLHLDEYVDMIIPRGGAGLHKFCRENSRIPVITGGIGICHLFVDESADLDAALQVVRNAKIQRPSVCNALDTVLVHRSVAKEFIPRLVQTLAPDGVSFRADGEALQVLSPAPEGVPDGVIVLAGPQDFDTEWLALVLGIRVVGGLDEAIDHISAHSTGHSDGILTGQAEHAHAFITRVDSAAVYVNASTRFTDGAQLGLGAEVAVSTQRLHARGPMGLRELTSYKWVIQGEYHTRPD
jgi:glutamate-5-semialdehyde dehydrogenase